MIPPYRRFVFWLNIPSFHQSAFVRALAERDGVEVFFGYEEDLPSDRRQMGWVLPNFGAARLVDVRDAAARQGLLEMADPTTCHAFGSFFALPHAGQALRALRDAPCGKVWISEPFDDQGWRGWVRTQRARLLVRRHAEAFRRVFAMGDLGTRFFRKAWVPEAKLSEFAYTVEPPEPELLNGPPPTTGESADPWGTQPGGHSASRPAELLFVGQLIPRKGVDLLLEGLAALRGGDWRLRIVGDGVGRGELETLAAALRIDRQVVFLGNRDNTETRRLIASADCLILPSRWDGWGAVVNEAIHCGTFVLVSDACGSAALVDGVTRGFTFRRHSPAKLAESVKRYLGQWERLVPYRHQTAAWSQGAISGQAVAEYFVASLASDRPSTPPWRRPSSS